MGALANAALLRVDPMFRQWVETAVVYVSRNVLMDDSAAPVGDRPVRHKLAHNSAVQPSLAVDLFLIAIACDPEVVGAPNNWSSAVPAMEPVIIQKVQNLFTGIARIIYFNEP